MNYSSELPKPPPPSTFQDRARRFGIFLRQRLDNQRLTRADFAAQLDMDEELVDGILNGELPLSQIGDELVSAMAVILKLEPDLLRIIIQRPEQTITDAVESATEPGEDVHATLESFRVPPDKNVNGQGRHGLDSVGSTLTAFQSEEIELKPKQPLSPLKDPTKTLETFQIDSDSLAQT